ncbi:MAG: AgmX/PglI C-terminal domain-containing protein [Myxococcota bacterium]
MANGRIGRMRWALVATVVAAAIGPGCAKEAKSPTAPPAAPGGGPPDAAVALPVVASPLASANRLTSSAVTGVDELGALTRSAAELGRWVDEHPEHAEAPAAMVASALLDVLAVGAATALDTPAGWQTLVARGDTPEKVMRAAIAALDKAQEAGATDAAPIREAAAAILGLDPDVKDVRLERASLQALMAEPRAEASAVRAVAAGRLLGALDAMATLPGEFGAELALRTAGRLLCNRCADLHHVTPDRVSEMLLNDSNRGGVICDSAIGAAATASSPAERVAALSSCSDFQTRGGEGEPPLLWAVNPPLIAVLREAARVAALDVPPGPLAGLIGRQMASLKTRLESSWVLPVAVVDGPLSQVASPDRTTLASIDGLSGDGLSVAALPLGMVSVGPEGVRAGLRPVVAMEDGELVSKSVSEDLPAGGRIIMSLPDLLAMKPDPATGAVPLLGSVMTEIARAEAALGSTTLPKPLMLPEESGRAMTLVLDEEATGAAVVRTIDGLRAAGVSHFFLEKTQRVGRVLPLLVREAPAAVEALLPTGFHRPIIAVVNNGSVEVWAPAGEDEEAPRVGDAKAPLPAGSTPSYSGIDVARLTVAAPASGTLGPTGAANAIEAIEWFVTRTGAGPVVHVVAGESALAGDVLRIVDGFQTRAGTAIEDPSAIWVGATCGGEAYDRLRRRAADCPTTAVIAFSRIAVPEARGLSATPAGNVKTRAKPAAVAEAAAGFCDKRTIQNGMAVRKASFRFCYERELRGKPGLEGRVEMRFVIGLDGKISGEPKVTSSTLKDAAVESCLVESVKKASFEKPDGGVCTVNWPFRFEPR